MGDPVKVTAKQATIKTTAEITRTISECGIKAHN